MMFEETLYLVIKETMHILVGILIYPILNVIYLTCYLDILILYLLVFKFTLLLIVEYITNVKMRRYSCFSILLQFLYPTTTICWHCTRSCLFSYCLLMAFSISPFNMDQSHQLFVLFLFYNLFLWLVPIWRAYLFPNEV